jgi:hypothetical protein
MLIAPDSVNKESTAGVESNNHHQNGSSTAVGIQNTPSRLLESDINYRAPGRLAPAGEETRFEPGYTVEEVDEREKENVPA